MTTGTAVAAQDRTVDARHGALPVRDYRPSEPVPGAAPVVWVHGGGFGAGSLDMPESHAFAQSLAAAGHPVTTVDYHLVPRFPLLGPFRMKPSPHRYPVPLEDVVDAFLDAAGRYPGRPVVLGGASAGACLAASAALRLRSGDGPRPAGLLLAYGLFHAQLPQASTELRARLKGLAKLGIGPEMVRRMTLNYAGTPELHEDPAVFPGTADVAGLPRTLLLDADRDALRSSGEAFAEHLRVASVPVEHLVVPESGHGFLGKPRSAPYQEGVRDVLDWIGRAS